MKSLILGIALALCTICCTANADYYVVQQPVPVYVMQTQPQSVVLVHQTYYYVVTVPMPYPVYIQQWYYWQQPYRVCRY